MFNPGDQNISGLLYSFEKMCIQKDSSVTSSLAFTFTFESWGTLKISEPWNEGEHHVWMVSKEIVRDNEEQFMFL